MASRSIRATIVRRAGVMAEPWHVSERDAHSHVWESTQVISDPTTGEMAAQKHSYVELTTAMHRWENGAVIKIAPTNNAGIVITGAVLAHDCGDGEEREKGVGWCQSLKSWVLLQQLKSPDAAHVRLIEHRFRYFQL